MAVATQEVAFLSIVAAPSHRYAEVVQGCESHQAIHSLALPRRRLKRPLLPCKRHRDNQRSLSLLHPPDELRLSHPSRTIRQVWISSIQGTQLVRLQQSAAAKACRLCCVVKMGALAACKLILKKKNGATSGACRADPPATIADASPGERQINDRFNGGMLKLYSYMHR